MSRVKVMYSDQMPGNKKVIPLEACDENELLSIQMKLDKDLRDLQTNQSILKSVVEAYTQCIKCVKSLNLDKFEMTTVDTFTDDVNRLIANKIITKEEAEEVKKKIKEKESDIQKLHKEKEQEKKEEKKEEKIEEKTKEETEETKENKETKETELKEETKPIKKETKKESLRNSEILVPLTRLIYTPGKVTDTNSFFVRLGTNYYLQRDAKQTVEYYEKKKKKVYGEIEKAKVALEDIQKNMVMVDYFIKRKRGIVTGETQTPFQS